MLRRLVFTAVLVTVPFAPFASLRALAQDSPDQPRPSMKPLPPMLVPKQGPSGLMQSLYATTVFVQGLDWDSTMTALNAGAVERNPLIEPFTKHRGAFAALKIGIATSAILAAHSLSKRHKVRAALALIAANLFYGAVSVRNYQIARDMRLAGGR